MARTLATASGVALRRCKRCHADRPVPEFPTCRRRGRVDVLSECSDCKRARDRADVAGKPGRAEGIAEKRKVAAGAALEWLSDLREASPCADCGASGKGARIRFFRRCDGAALNLMASNGLSVATVRAAAGASVPLCGACAGRAGAAMRFSGRHVAL